MERAAIEAMLRQMFQVMDPEWEYEQRHPDFVADMPQSRERLASREALREMQRAFGDPPRITLRRLVGEGDTWVAEADSDYGGTPYMTVVIFELRDDLIVREPGTTPRASKRRPGARSGSTRSRRIAVADPSVAYIAQRR